MQHHAATMRRVFATGAAVLLLAVNCFAQSPVVFNKRPLNLPAIPEYRLVLDKHAQEYRDEIALGRHPDNDLVALYVADAEAGRNIRHVAVYSRDAGKDGDMPTEVWNREREAAGSRFEQIIFPSQESSRPKHEKDLKTFYDIGELTYSEHKIVKQVLGGNTCFSYLSYTKGTGVIREKTVEFGFFSTATVQYVNKNILLIFAYEVGLPGNLTSERIEGLTARYVHDLQKMNYID
jgi:hypothetical protein